MQRVFCSTVLVAALSVAGLTACGDKVNVTQPAPDSVVTAVNVTPLSQTLNVGDKFTFVATVVAGPQQTNRNVTWTSSNTAVATVDNAGVVTAVKGGVASIIAASAANPAVKGAAAVTVNAVVEASVTIGQINQTKCDLIGGCTSVPAVLNNVANQLDVTLNVDAGTQKVSEVDLIMNCGTDTIVAKQVLAAADVAPDAEDASAPVTLSFNTAAFNPTTGAVAFKNGQCTIKAKAITTAGTQVASGDQQLTLNNVDTVAATITTAPVGSQKASATDAGGLLWRAGTVTVTAVPVIYSSGITAASGSISLVNVSGVAGVKGNAGTILAGSTIATQTNIAPTTGAISATFPKDASAAGVDSITVAGVGVSVTTVTSAGNPGPAITASTANMIRLDNFAPPNRVKVDLSKFNGTGGWLGKSFVFTTAAGTVDLGSNTAVADSAAWDHGGVDNVTFTTQSRPNGAPASAWATFASVTGLAETSASSGAGSYDLRLVMCDALNNCVNGSAIPFGVDLTTPSVAQLTGPTDKEIFNIDSVPPTSATFNVVDTSNTAGVTPSGPSLGQEVLVTIQGLLPSGTGTSSKTACLTGVATGSGTAITCKAPVTQNQASVPVPDSTGEYTATVIGIDQAGNQSTAISFKYYVDTDAPKVSGGVTIPNPITTGTSFALSATDSMDVAAGAGSLQFAGFAFFETGTSSSAGVAFDNVLTRAGTVSVSLATFYRGLSAAIDAAGTSPTGLNIRAVDAANNISLNTTVALPAANMSTPGTITSTGAAGITAAAAFVVPAADTVGQTLALSDSLTAAGPTTASPFTQVCFYYTSPSGTPGGTGGPQGVVTGELVKIGCTASLSAVGSAPRKLGYSITFKVPEILRGTAPTIYAVGQTSNLDALITSAGVLTVAP